MKKEVKPKKAIAPKAKEPKAPVKMSKKAKKSC